MTGRTRLLALAGAVTLLLFALPPLAYAAGGMLESTFGAKGTRGESMWMYVLSIDRGGVTDPGTLLWAFLTDISWSLYTICMAAAIWLVDWALSFSWVGVVATPLLDIGDAMQNVVDNLGLVPTMLTITALFGGIAILRGRWAKGGWDIALSLIIAALASGIFAQPVRYVAGENGLLYGARDTGLELAAAVIAKSSEQPPPTTPGDAKAQLVGAMVDSFIRLPHQVVNFGAFIDGTHCAEPYQKGLVETNGNTDNTALRDQVAKCDEVLGEYAEKPSPSMWLNSLFIGPAALIFGAMALVLAGSVISSGIAVMFQGLKAIVTLITGLLPGGAKRSVLMTFAETAMYLVVLVFTTVFLALFLGILQVLFRNSTNPGLTFLIVDVLLVIGILQYRTHKRRILAAATGLAAAMAGPAGAGTPSRLPNPGNPVRDAIALGSNLRNATRKNPRRDQPVSSPHMSQSMSMSIYNLVQHDGRTGPGGGGPGGSGPVPPTGPRRRQIGSAANTAAATGDRKAPKGPPGSGFTKALGTAAEVGLHLAGAVTTGGTSTAATAIAVAAKAHKARQIAGTINQTRKALSAPNGERRAAVTGMMRQALTTGRAPGKTTGAASSPGPTPTPPTGSRTTAAVPAGKATLALPAGPQATAARTSGTRSAGTPSQPTPVGTTSRSHPAARTSTNPAAARPATSSSTGSTTPPATGRSTPAVTPTRPVPSHTRQQYRRVIKDGVVILIPKE